MIPAVGKFGGLAEAVQSVLIRLAIVAVMALAFSAHAFTQGTQVPEIQPGQIMGTVTDVNGDIVPGAAVVLAGPATADRRTVETSENGFFQFDDVTPGVGYRVDISAQGFAGSSSAITIAPGEVKILGEVRLALAMQQTTVRVSGNPIEIATEQVKFEETQRVLGIIPNFYVSYEGDNTAPLTTGMKFRLALKVSHDPVAGAGIAIMAAIRQATDTPDYRQGLKGYSERFSADATDSFTDIMIGGAVLPSLLHQDPRYFYQGTGTKRSRLRHAMLAPFVCKGDNGRWQPNYSTVGGDLASSALSNLYYPQSDRGTGLVLSGFAISTAERLLSTVAQEFVLSRFTHRGGGDANPSLASLQQ
ncbi:MAG: carboxypeptidase-like regulatory domain-containing protein [Candidatus Acidiferrales bacterium]